jgi:hypothetical protein
MEIIISPWGVISRWRRNAIAWLAKKKRAEMMDSNDWERIKQRSELFCCFN